MTQAESKFGSEQVFQNKTYVCNVNVAFSI